MKFIVCAPQIVHQSGGVRVLHLLAAELRGAGHDVTVYDMMHGFGQPLEMTELGVPWQKTAASPEDIVIFPDIVDDGPAYHHLWENLVSEHTRLVWYLLNRPYYLTERLTAYRSHDLLISYNSAMDPYLPQLPLLLDDRHLFHPPEGAEKKNTACVYFGKWINSERMHRVASFLKQFDEVFTITRTEPATRDVLAEMIRTSSVLITFDCLTNLVQEALLCHTPVYVIDDRFQLLRTGWCGMTLHGIFTHEAAFSKATQAVKAFNAEFDQAILGNSKRIRNFATMAAAWFSGRDRVQRDPVLFDYLKNLQSARYELDAHRYCAFFIADVRSAHEGGDELVDPVDSGLPEVAVGLGSNPEAVINDGRRTVAVFTALVQKNAALLEMNAGLLKKISNLQSRIDTLKAAKKSFKEALRAVYKTVRVWNQRPWLSRAFHRLRLPHLSWLSTASPSEANELRKPPGPSEAVSPLRGTHE